MSYLGLVPGERSSGATIRRGVITKADAEGDSYERLQIDAKALKGSVRSSSIGRTGKTSVRTFRATVSVGIGQAAHTTCAVPDIGPGPAQGETVRMRRVPSSAHVIFSRKDYGLIDHYR